MGQLPKRCKVYLNEIKRLSAGHQLSDHWLDLLRFFPAWYFSLNNTSPICDERPWVTFAAIDFLQKRLNRNQCVFEYGSGGSTLFFAKRVKHVTSVEHDQQWAHVVSEAMQRKGLANWTYYVARPSVSTFPTGDPASPHSYASNSIKARNLLFVEYVKIIDEYPDSYFDVVLIDGRARPSCFYHSFSKVKRGGFLILDNAERPHYALIHNSLANKHWTRFNFYGPGPYNSYFWQTCIWQKNDDSHEIIKL